MFRHGTTAMVVYFIISGVVVFHECGFQVCQVQPNSCRPTRTRLAADLSRSVSRIANQEASAPPLLAELAPVSTGHPASLGGLGDILKHVPMSDDYQRIELITGTARRRRWTTEQKLRIIEASCEPGESVSSVARRHGVAPNLLYRWRRLMAQGGAAAVGSDEPVVGNSEVRRLEERIRELERLLGRKTMEVEILKEALAKAQAKKPSLQLVSLPKDAFR